MLKISVNSLKPGTRLGKDIYSKDSKLLLRRGTFITQAHLNVFAKRRIREVYILESDLPVKVLPDFECVYNNCLNTVKSFMLRAKLGEGLDFEEIGETINSLFEQVLNQADILKKMRLIKKKGEYLFSHSVNVALLCMLLGKWLDCEPVTIKELGLAGLFHDIGKVYVDEAILNKPGRLTAAEFEHIKKHTLLGYIFLNDNSWINKSISSAVLMHHERADGSGYPLGKKGYDVNFYAAVVAVADIYDAITSDRVYSPKRSPCVAMETIWDESFGRLNPKITKVFFDRMTSFFMGKRVLLSNNQEGTVVYVDPGEPTKPTVMAGNRLYNLRVDRSISIKRVID